MSTQAPQRWLVVSPHPQLQPIRLPVAEFLRFQAEFDAELSRYVAEHRRRFPQADERATLGR